jgi:DNA-binding TFAR19-related protein (PDSD5 family)
MMKGGDLADDMLKEIISFILTNFDTKEDINNLKNLSLVSKKFKNAIDFKSIKSLNLSPYGKKITDESLKGFVEIFPNLEAINLYDCIQITTTGLEYLSKLPLKKIILPVEKTTLHYETLDEIRKKYEELFLKTEKNQQKFIKFFPRIEEFDLYDMQIAMEPYATILKNIINLPLKKLRLGNNGLNNSPDSFQILKPLKNTLEFLEIDEFYSGSSHGEMDFEFFGDRFNPQDLSKTLKHFTKLKVLKLISQVIDDKTIESMDNFHNLIELKLGGTRNITENGFSNLKNLKKLKFLGFYNKPNGIDKYKIALTNLKYLHYTPLETLEIINGNDPDANKITSDDIQYITGFKNLKNLILYRPNITEDVEKELKKSFEIHEMKVNIIIKNFDDYFQKGKYRFDDEEFSFAKKPLSYGFYKFPELPKDEGKKE